jgi:methyl coenzyme M reductase beta subunit
VIDDSTESVSWNGTVADIAADISDLYIKFQYRGYKYVISRQSGEIRFYNPKEMAKWKEYRNAIVRAAILGGKGSARGHAEVDARLRTEFSANEHVGQCTPIDDGRKF